MPPSILWLCRDFRFRDNAAMAAAAAAGPVLPVFLIDRGLRAQGAASRWRIERALRAFDAELRRRHGAAVLVLEGEPEALLPDLTARIGAAALHMNDWPEPGTIAAQQRLGRALAGTPARLVLHPGHLLLHPRALRTGSGGAYRVFTPFARTLRAIGPDRPGGEAPRLAPLADPPQGLALDRLDLAPDLHRGRAVLERHALPAGEAAALARLGDFLDRAGDYAAQRDRPDRDATSGLSESLAVGEIGPRDLWAIATARARADSAAGAGIAAFLTELIWREFAWHLLIAFPRLARQPWRPEWSDFPWRGASGDLTRWQRAETGIALVDAGLREMRVTGRMHNRVRMVAASWLTKHLLTDWRLGLAHFADSLTDWDPASNAMNWQWVAGCGPDAAPFFRIFNPERQAAQFDPQGRYRRRWLLGWQGAEAEEARGYFDSLPPAWQVSRHYAEDGADPTSGRARALAAHAAFRHRVQGSGI
ncbi:deoxyribodipyrimidine photo-lyase [Paracoccus sp. MKU1]|uniref:cryptochrome/photolyase family protein n=1 Tax=Paracoccus sp. MKU1 TaxID=1745182 RepID=UPI0007193E78|nr:deoxyribodipyrimidine photo-lyase [Paracoccus sp. MKU1]KRW96345.1 DNA photolyase [Paracoccus sp. MKU1]